MATQILPQWVLPNPEMMCLPGPCHVGTPTAEETKGCHITLTLEGHEAPYWCKKIPRGCPLCTKL